jgi:hypothetical protein
VPAAHADRYGFYQINDIKTYSKFELMFLQNQKPGNWKWNYNDEFFSSYNWHKEPDVSINELYRRRAQQLRNDYDYLMVYYSGGYDSSNLLYAFLENNIHIDELCVFYSSLDRVSNQFEEVTHFTLDKISILKQQYPKLKIRMLDYGPDFFKWNKITESAGYSKDLIHMFGSSFVVNKLITDNFYKSVVDWQRLIESGKKLAWIHGCDKPMIRYLNGEWIFNFHDAIVSSNITTYRQYIDQGNIGTYEFFYWAPSHECAEILIKQCHLLKNFYNHAAQQNFSAIPGAKKFKPGYGWEISNMHVDFVKTIYPRLFIHSEKFYTKKNSQFSFGNRDQWFFNSNHECVDLHQDIYKATNSNSHAYLKPWYNNHTDIFSGLKSCISVDHKF